MNSSIYGAFGEYERSIRERKFRIAEKEDIIANLKKQIQLTKDEKPKLQQSCTTLALLLQVEETRFQSESQLKCKFEAENAHLEKKCHEQADRLTIAYARLQKVKDFKNSRKLELQAIEEDHMQQYKKDATLSELITTTERVLRLEDSYKDNHRILEERTETLKQMQKESHEEWGAFVDNCVGLAESSNFITLLQKRCEQLEFRKKNPFVQHPELTPLPAPIIKVSGYGKTPLPPKMPQPTSAGTITKVVVSSMRVGDQDKEEDETPNDQNGSFIFKTPLPPKVPQQAAVEVVSMDIAVTEVEIQDDQIVNFEVPLPLPPKVTQATIAKVVSSIYTEEETLNDQNVSFKTPLPQETAVEAGSMDIVDTQIETLDGENVNFEAPLPLQKLPPEMPQPNAVEAIAKVPSSISFGDTNGGETNGSNNFKTPLPPKGPQQTSVGLFSMDIGGVAENEPSNDHDSGAGFFNFFGSMDPPQTGANTSFSFNFFDPSDTDISQTSSSNSMFF